MKSVSKFGLFALAFVLVGQGCLAGNGGAEADGAVWRTDDGGANWTQLATLPQATGTSTIAGVSVTALEFDPSDSSFLYAGSVANGLFYSRNNGNTWQRPEDQEARTGEIVDVEVHPNDVCTVYVMKPKRILKSTDCQRTYQTVYTEGREDEQLTKMVLDWFNPGTLWIGTSAGEVIRSTDGAVSWSTVHRTDSDVVDITLSNKDSRIVLVGTNRKGLFRSSDGGASWVSMERDLAREFQRSDVVYGFGQSGKGDVIVMASRFGLLASRDNGETWQEMSIIPPPGELKIWNVAFNPKNDNELYYGTVGTLYHSENGGETWSAESMPSARAPLSMKVHPDSTENLFVGFGIPAE